MAELYENENAVSQYSANVNNDFPDFAKSIIDFVKAERCITGDGVMEFMVDAGCGTGGSTRIFTKFFKHILGVDPSEECLVTARNETTSPNIEYKVGSGESIPVKNETVDVMISYFAIQYMDISKYVMECKRVLKHDGLALSFGHDYDNIELLDGSKNPSSVQGLLKSFFQKAKLYFPENLPDVACWLDRYQSIYDKVSGINKKRVDNITYQQNMKLADFKRRLLSIPEYHTYDQYEHIQTGTHPVDQLMSEVKQRWELTDTCEEDIPIRMTYSFFIICLRK